MRLRRNDGIVGQRGFTLLELLLVMLILSLIVGAVFSQLSDAQQRLNAEENKLGDFQEARDFVDQFFNDINQAGNPNVRMFDTSQTFSPALTTQSTYTWANTYINDSRFAIGLVKIDASTLAFEGSLNGDGTVQSVIYQVNGSGTCTYCLQRSQANKVNGNSLTAQSTNWGREINDVVNSSTPIFKYFQYDGTQVTSLPQDISTAAGAAIIASIKTIQINLTIQNSSILDLKTGTPIQSTFEGEVSLNNCSMAASAQLMSC